MAEAASQHTSAFGETAAKSQPGASSAVGSSTGLATLLRGNWGGSLQLPGIQLPTFKKGSLCSVHDPERPLNTNHVRQAGSLTEGNKGNCLDRGDTGHGGQHWDQPWLGFR